MEKLRQWIIFSLLGLMIVKACLIPLLYLDYEIRYDYIIANLCENRDLPQLECKGKCYLAKRIAQAEKQQQKQAEQEYMSKLLLQPMDINTYTSTFFGASGIEKSTILYDYLSSSILPVALQALFRPPLQG